MKKTLKTRNGWTLTLDPDNTLRMDSPNFEANRSGWGVIRPAENNLGGEVEALKEFFEWLKDGELGRERDLVEPNLVYYEELTEDGRERLRILDENTGRSFPYTRLGVEHLNPKKDNSIDRAARIWFEEHPQLCGAVAPVELSGPFQELGDPLTCNQHTHDRPPHIHMKGGLTIIWGDDYEVDTP